MEVSLLHCSTQWGIIPNPLASKKLLTHFNPLAIKKLLTHFKRHNLVNIQFAYMKISDNIEKGMLSLKIWK